MNNQKQCLIATCDVLGKNKQTKTKQPSSLCTIFVLEEGGFFLVFFPLFSLKQHSHLFLDCILELYLLYFNNFSAILFSSYWPEIHRIQQDNLFKN